MSYEVTTNRNAITERAAKAESISNALTGITRLLEKNGVYKDSAGPEPFIDNFTEGCLFEALNVISRAMQANHLACLLGENAADIQTFQKLKYQDAN